MSRLALAAGLGDLLGPTVDVPLLGALGGRAVMLALVTVAMLGLAGLAVLATGSAELRAKWTTWAVIAPAVGLPVWAGRTTTAVLAAVIAVLACLEYGRLMRLHRGDTLLLVVLAVAVPFAALHRPGLLSLTPALVLLAALPALLDGDAVRGFERSALSGFGVVWICWSLSALVLLWSDAYLLCFAAALADVGAWCAGKGLRGLRIGAGRPFARPLSRLSPNKTVGGLVGSLAGASLLLGAFGELRAGYVLAIALGAVAGDLVESMAKRQAGVKDAGAWLPGFGGLLDRVDSLLLVLPIAMVLA